MVSVIHPKILSTPPRTSKNAKTRMNTGEKSFQNLA